MKIDISKVPTHLRSEVEKYLADPKRYIKLYPVAYKFIRKYVESEPT